METRRDDDVTTGAEVAGEDTKRSAVERATARLKIRDEEIAQLKSKTEKELAGVGKKNRKKKKEIRLRATQYEQYIRNKCEEEMFDEFDEKTIAEAIERLALSEDSAEKKEAAAPTSDTSEKGVKLSRAQKRRMKKAEAERKRQEEKDALRRALAGSSSRERELAAISAKLKKIGLRMKEIPSDGHCLYRAIVHQLTTTKSGYCPSTKDGHLEIRKLAANFMRTHEDDFLPFLTTAIGQSAEGALAKHCSRVESSADWGGQLELRAIAQALKKPIVVHSADAPSVRMGEDFSGPPLHLTYHKHYYALGEHYNATLAA
eukprot:g1830.t1